MSLWPYKVHDLTQKLIYGQRVEHGQIIVHGYTQWLFHSQWVVVGQTMIHGQKMITVNEYDWFTVNCEEHGQWRWMVNGQLWREGSMNMNGSRLNTEFTAVNTSNSESQTPRNYW